MPSKHDYRNSPPYREAAGKVRRLQGRPLVGSHALREIALITEALPELKFPINSAGELLDQLGDDSTRPVLGMALDPALLIKRMPAYYFPIASYENFVEKMNELMNANRRTVDRPKYERKIKEKFRGAKYPIGSPAELERVLGETPRFNINGHKMDTRKTISQLPEDFFPIRDEKDLKRKAFFFLSRRPLIERD
jgi:hypothetical protein